MVDFQEKYNKYKNKYLELKNSIISEDGVLEGGILEGGILEGGAFFKNTTKLYLMANITDKSIYDRLDERRALLLRGNQPKQPILHITLLQFEINQDHPYSYIFYSRDFHSNLKRYFNSTMVKNKVTLSSGFGEYDLLGKGENKFFVKMYKPNKKMEITKFRTKIYGYLERELGKPKIRKKVVGGKTYVVFYYDKQELIAIPDFYYGKGVWTPHVSILNIGDIRAYNKPLYRKYKNRKTKKGKLQLLFTPIVNARFRPIGKIKMNEHIGNLTLSLRNPKAKIDREYIL